MNRRRRNIYLILILIGASALAVDRLLLSQGSSTPAAALAVESTNPTGPEPSTLTESPVATVDLHIPFPENLPPVDVNPEIMDIFESVPARRRAALGSETGSNRDRDADNSDVTLDASAFVSRHHLTGVVIYGHVAVAIVDGRWLRVGGSLSGCELKSMTGNGAVFQCGDESAILTVRDRSQSRAN